MEASNPEEQEIHLSDYFLVLAKHKTLIFLLTLLTVSVTVFTTMQMKPVYEAGAPWSSTRSSRLALDRSAYRL